jgi:hypothetical protein
MIPVPEKTQAPLDLIDVMTPAEAFAALRVLAATSAAAVTRAAHTVAALSAGVMRDAAEPGPVKVALCADVSAVGTCCVLAPGHDGAHADGHEAPRGIWGAGISGYYQIVAGGASLTRAGHSACGDCGDRSPSGAATCTLKGAHDGAHSDGHTIWPRSSSWLDSAGTQRDARAARREYEALRAAEMGAVPHAPLPGYPASVCAICYQPVRLHPEPPEGIDPERWPLPPVAAPGEAQCMAVEEDGGEHWICSAAAGHPHPNHAQHRQLGGAVMRYWPVTP